MRTLLAVAGQRELPQLDEKLYLEVFAAQGTAAAKRRPQRLPAMLLAFGGFSSPD